MNKARPDSHEVRLAADPTLFCTNAERFRMRFPLLFELHKSVFSAPPSLPANCLVIRSRKGDPTLIEAGRQLHSAYDPRREGEKLAESQSAQGAAAFFGFGLGHAPLAFARRYPDKRLILVEPDPLRLALALSYMDWTDIFSHADCVLLIAAEPEAALALFEKSGIDSTGLIAQPAQTLHAQAYFDTLSELIKRNKRKEALNRHTTRRFGPLWLRNSLHNLSLLADCADAGALQGQASGLPACIIAAGPSLSKLLPLLPRIQERCLTICVDTALRFCLRAGIEPDIIVSADPQFWNSRHLAGLSSPSSILVSELAAHPASFRLPCRQRLLFSSPYPPGQFAESRMGGLTELSCGGSVASSAWELARIAGSEAMYLAGLDLGFPGGELHVRGSIFEERMHAESARLAPAETLAVGALFTATRAEAKDYAGRPLHTDERMQLYAWWFESRLAHFPHCRTYTLSEESLCIPGVLKASPEDLGLLPPVTEQKKRLFALLSQSAQAADLHTLTRIREDFEHALREIEGLAQRLTQDRAGLRKNVQDILSAPSSDPLHELSSPAVRSIAELLLAGCPEGLTHMQETAGNFRSLLMRHSQSR